MKQSKLIAVTGGIGSGKSVVAAYIAEKGYPVLSCDEIYHRLLDEGRFDRLFKDTFCDAFTDGKVDLKKLSAIVFSDKEKLALLNHLTHPIVLEEMSRQAKKYPLCFVEVQLLFESGAQSLFDEIIVVTREREARVTAVMARSRLSRQEVEQRIIGQFDYDEADLTKYLIVENNETLQSLYSRVDQVLALIVDKKVTE